ncbi:hypothetical protein, partial [Klebsiella pneumoniae]|uniref:hypothetical protein n=1 Tax=Klebsiella pneumoniae TaxID=573 RepID=UPI001E405A17
YKKKNNLYLFHIPSLYLKTPAFIPEHRKSVFQIILDNFCLPVRQSPATLEGQIWLLCSAKASYHG